MQAAKLRQRVIFRRRSATLDAHGTEDSNSWVPIATVYASVEPIVGREFFSALQTQSEITTRIVCRHSSEITGVTTKDRIEHNGKLYDIRSIINVNARSKELQFMCTDHEG